VGFYGEHVLPRVLNLTCGASSAAPLRARVCRDLAGEVVEIGFGSGLNVPFYPGTVTGVSAVEPVDAAWRLADKRIRSAPVRVQRTGLDGQALPHPDDSFDAALSTWTLCTIPDPAAALAEVRRVLRPGGSLHFVEHGLAPDDDVRAWQHRIEPTWRRAFGCHLTRPVVDLVTEAGFTITDLDQFYESGAPRFAGAAALGTAVAA
jgi:ubiquinone/menaquinone biosynthesis C-methylase UbiE